MLIVSFIRHAESLDNLKPIWAGHKDAELSNLGVRQAQALGHAYANTRLDAIITSDLKRAHATAVALLDSQPEPKPYFKVDRILREQYVGDAEGRPFLLKRIPHKSLEDHFRDRQYPIIFDRNQRFPNGECLKDVAARAERAIDDLVLKPYLPRAISGDEDVHVAVVSHGVCIGELIPVLLKRNHCDVPGPTSNYRGLLNTAWIRITVQVKPGSEIPGITNELENLPPLIVTVTDVNRHEHITNVEHKTRAVYNGPEKRPSIWQFLSGRKKLAGTVNHVESDTLNEAGIEERKWSIWRYIGYRRESGAGIRKS